MALMLHDINGVDQDVIQIDYYVKTLDLTVEYVQLEAYI